MGVVAPKSADGGKEKDKRKDKGKDKGSGDEKKKDKKKDKGSGDEKKKDKGSGDEKKKEKGSGDKKKDDGEEKKDKGEGDCHAEEDVSVGFTPEEYNLLSLKLVKGVDLVAKDANGKSDPYVVVEFDGKKFKSPTIKSTLNPTWNHALL